MSPGEQATIRLKRIYEPASADDGVRVLVERLWPRGVSKERAALDAWVKHVAPSTALRKWYGHAPERWPEFRERYWRELRGNPAAVEELKGIIGAGPATFLYAARDRERNSAVALERFISDRGA